VDRFIHPDRPEQALVLAVKCKAPLAHKALYYSVATTCHLDDATPASDGPSSQDTDSLSPELIQRCKDLLNDLISHFTPILFTVATAKHMACTDVLAETWMPLVIQPALENNGLCRPIETLQQIIDLDWKSEGLCESCVGDKREEWREEQRVIWDRLDIWLGPQEDES